MMQRLVENDSKERGMGNETYRSSKDAPPSGHPSGMPTLSTEQSALDSADEELVQRAAGKNTLR